MELDGTRQQASAGPSSGHPPAWSLFRSAWAITSGKKNNQGLLALVATKFFMPGLPPVQRCITENKPDAADFDRFRFFDSVIVHGLLVIFFPTNLLAPFAGGPSRLIPPPPILPLLQLEGRLIA